MQCFVFITLFCVNYLHLGLLRTCESTLSQEHSMPIIVKTCSSWSQAAAQNFALNVIATFAFVFITKVATLQVLQEQS
jgi:predicted thioesterase